MRESKRTRNISQSRHPRLESLAANVQTNDGVPIEVPGPRVECRPEIIQRQRCRPRVRRHRHSRRRVHDRTLPSTVAVNCTERTAPARHEWGARVTQLHSATLSRFQIALDYPSRTAAARDAARTIERLAALISAGAITGRRASWQWC